LEKEESQMKIRSEVGKPKGTGEPAAKMDRRGFLKAGGKVIPALAALGLTLTAPQLARADDCSNTCATSCAVGCTGNCAHTCEGDCESTCKNSCGDACGGTCEGDCKGACNSTSK
jgi:CXXX repeat radical SAM target protein